MSAFCKVYARRGVLKHSGAVVHMASKQGQQSTTSAPEARPAAVLEVDDVICCLLIAACMWAGTAGTAGEYADPADEICCCCC